jgi:hypothetical protein
MSFKITQCQACNGHGQKPIIEVVLLSAHLGRFIRHDYEVERLAYEACVACGGTGIEAMIHEGAEDTCAGVPAWLGSGAGGYDG